MIYNGGQEAIALLQNQKGKVGRLLGYGIDLGVPILHFQGLNYHVSVFERSPPYAELMKKGQRSLEM